MTRALELFCCVSRLHNPKSDGVRREKNDENQNAVHQHREPHCGDILLGNFVRGKSDRGCTQVDYAHPKDEPKCRARVSIERVEGTAPRNKKKHGPDNDGVDHYHGGQMDEALPRSPRFVEERIVEEHGECRDTQDEQPLQIQNATPAFLAQALRKAHEWQIFGDEKRDGQKQENNSDHRADHPKYIRRRLVQPELRLVPARQPINGRRKQDRRDNEHSCPEGNGREGRPPFFLVHDGPRVHDQGGIQRDHERVRRERPKPVTECERGLKVPVQTWRV